VSVVGPASAALAGLGGVVPAVLQGVVTAETLQGVFSTTAARTIGTLLALVVFLATTAAAYRLGPLLGRALPGETVEAVQAVVVTVVAVGVGAFLTVIWRAIDDVTAALAVVEPTPKTGVKLLLVALAFGVAYTATRITKRLIGVGAGRDTISSHQREVLHHVVQIVIFFPALLFSLRLFGVPAGSLLLSASALGVVLGLAARQTLGAAIAGFVLLFSRPFEVGDWVELHANEGIVTEISVFNTQLRTFDNSHVMIPNDRITDEAITNYSKEDWLRASVDVGVDYGAEVERAMTVAAEAMASCEEIADEPAPDVVVDEFADSAVVLTLLFWIEEPTIQRKWAARNAAMEAVKAAFEREGVGIPFPQRELSARGEGEALRTVGIVDAEPDEEGAASDGEDDPDDGTTPEEPPSADRGDDD
jgi:small-conductance mechanosensitive channel